MWHASCSQICRITSHIRACGPSSGDAFESVARRQPFWPSRITTQIQPASLTAKITVNLLLATSIWPPPLAAIILIVLAIIASNSARVSSVVLPLYTAPRNSRICLSAVSSHLVSHIDPLARAPTIPGTLCWLAALAQSTVPTSGPGKERLSFQEALTASSIYCQKRHLAVAAPSATRPAYLIRHLHRHTHNPRDSL